MNSKRQLGGDARKAGFANRVITSNRSLRWMSLLLFCSSLALLLTAGAQESRQALDFTDPPSLDVGQQLLLKGHNLESSELILVIRIDDRDNPGYADRVNLERVVPPGPFELQIGFGGLRTPAGRPLQLEEIRRIIVFQGTGDGGLMIEPLLVVNPGRLPVGVKGWDLGPTGSPIWPGFESIARDYPGLHGANLKTIDRGERKQAAEGLTTDGIRGIERLNLPLTRGRWFITLWLRDPGEWEYLPHPHVRHVSANSQPVWSKNYSTDSWIQNVYLAGRTREATPDDDAWVLFGERPKERVSFMAEVGDDGLQLAFSGDQPEAGFLAAVLAEPDAAYPIRQKVESDRARWWQNNWRVSGWPEQSRNTTVLEALQQSIVAARDTSANLTFDLDSGSLIAAPQVNIEAPTFGDTILPVELRWGQWHLKRSGLASTLLIPSNDYLRADDLPPGRSDGPPRRLHLKVRVPRNTQAGQYNGKIEILIGDSALHAPLLVNVPDVTLPPADLPIGVYLERPVHFDWFDETRAYSDQAMVCDLNFLARQGLTGIAPPLSTPTTPEGMERLLHEIRTTLNAGFRPPFLAYAPFKRLSASLGLEGALLRLSEMEDMLAAEGMPSPVWAIADEPSNPGQTAPVGKIKRYARTFAPLAKLGGQLNNPDDIRHLDAFDLVLLNDSFGIDIEDIDRVKAAGVTPWLYNLENPRAAAGFYLWRIGAQGYLQWHARMPTADPFDPTDGREDDVQFLYPMDEPCPVAPDVDNRLFELADGIIDLRWLLWLEQIAAHNTEARKLLQQLHDETPDDWQSMLQVSSGRLNEWRKAITDLAAGDLLIGNNN
ncbi:MAG: hypothetical protein GY703_23110 [Gammaproteobacteria bacterium]|nr:hypothetical protein [Gammaproteobacteria bacterium]